MSDLDEDKKTIQLITSEYVDKLTIIWKQIFHPDICKENSRKLIDHVTYFYKELVEETMSRKIFIENEINDLKREAENLKRLLNIDVKLPSCVNSDLPLLLVQSELDKSLESLREQLKLRKEEISELLLEQEDLCSELGETPHVLKLDPLPTDQEIENFHKHLETLRNEKVERMHLISTMRKEIKHFLQLLELQVNDEHEDRLLNYENKLNKETIEALKIMHYFYSSKVKELRENILCIRKKLDTLWGRLQTSPRTRNNFNCYKEYDKKTYDVLCSELRRCETLKNANIKNFVEQIRKEILKMWEKTLKSESQKNSFPSFNSTQFTNDLLMQHEMELENLKSYYEVNKQIFELYAERTTLWDRKNALEANTYDPSRYNNRGGQLLKEEKERKIITAKLPKIERKLYELVKIYEERENTPFLVYGKNILDVMSTQKQHEEELSQSARKHASTNSITKINFSRRTHLSVNNTFAGNSPQATLSAASSLLNVTSARKPTSNSTSLHTPLAKRSLMSALNSPNVFQNPSTSKTKIQHVDTNKKFCESSSNVK